jgi:hypothetical protein
VPVVPIGVRMPEILRTIVPSAFLTQVILLRPSAP